MSQLRLRLLPQLSCYAILQLKGLSIISINKSMSKIFYMILELLSFKPLILIPSSSATSAWITSPS